MNEVKENWKLLKKSLEELKDEELAIHLINYEKMTLVPLKAYHDVDKLASRIYSRIISIFKSDAYLVPLKALAKNSTGLNSMEKRVIHNHYKDYQNEHCVSKKMLADFNNLGNDAYTAWIKAKNAQSYEIFEPYLHKLVAMKKKMLSLRPHKLPNAYDYLISDYEEGMTQADLDKFFNYLKEPLKDLLHRINLSTKIIRVEFLNRSVPISKQEEFSNYLMDVIGFNKDEGLLGTTEHPFTDSISEHDTRITTHYYELNVLSNIYSVIHEGGHAIFGQNEPAKFFKYYLNDSMTMGMHESISRFYENLIGRSEEFVHQIFPTFMKIFNDEFQDISERELYEGINQVIPSLIRTDADELTYTFHIMIRYELERDMMEGKLETKDLEKAWNKLYESYLGVVPSNACEGVLQDVHWTDGGFGYFPTYALGNAYGAQILHQMKKDLDVSSLVSNGKLETIKEWLKIHVFSFASLLNPSDWIQKITKEPLNPQYFLDYLTEKYTKLYNL